MNRCDTVQPSTGSNGVDRNLCPKRKIHQLEPRCRWDINTPFNNSAVRKKLGKSTARSNISARRWNFGQKFSLPGTHFRTHCKTEVLNIANMYNYDDCCHEFCQGGCDKPDNHKTCSSCTYAYDDEQKQCVRKCQSRHSVDPKTYERFKIDNKYIRYQYGHTCLKKCPKNMLLPADTYKCDVAKGRKLFGSTVCDSEWNFVQNSTAHK